MFVPSRKDLGRPTEKYGNVGKAENKAFRFIELIANLHRLVLCMSEFVITKTCGLLKVVLDILFPIIPF